MSLVPKGALPMHLAGEELWLLPGRALWWPRLQTLAVADVHFGKGASFRAAGVPVPAGTTAANLSSLNQLIAETRLAHLLFLGDMFHSRTGREAATPALRSWRHAHPDLRITLVRGNHERHAGDPEPKLEIELVDEPFQVGPIQFGHHPHWSRPGSEGLLIAGHLHPVFEFAHGRERLRLPCFWLRNNCLVLPAFGDFTGGHAMKRGAGDRVFLVSREAVHAVPY